MPDGGLCLQLPRSIFPGSGKRKILLKEQRRVIPLRMKLPKSSTFLADSMRRHRWGREPNPFRNRHGQPREKIGIFSGACGEKWNFSRRTNTGSRPMGRGSVGEETKRERKEGDAPMNEVAKKFRFSRGSLGAASMGRGPGTFRNRAPLPSQDGFYLSV